MSAGISPYQMKRHTRNSLQGLSSFKKTHRTHCLLLAYLHFLHHIRTLYCTVQNTACAYTAHCRPALCGISTKYISPSVSQQKSPVETEGGHPWPFKAEMVAFQLWSDRLFLRVYTPCLFIYLPLSDLYNDLLTKEEALSADRCLKNIAVVCSSFPTPQHTPFQTQLSA